MGTVTGFLVRMIRDFDDGDFLTRSPFAVKIIGVLGALMLAGLMALDFVANNLWRWLPEFHTLDSVAAFSLYLQIPLLLLALVILLMALRGRRLLWWLFVPAALLSCLSWYSVRLSNAENAIVFGAVPLMSFKMHFSEIETVRFETGSLVLMPGKRVIPIPPKFMGFDSAAVVNELQSYGGCLQEVQSVCREIRFVWP